MEPALTTGSQVASWLLSLNLLHPTDIYDTGRTIAGHMSVPLLSGSLVLSVLEKLGAGTPSTPLKSENTPGASRTRLYNH